MDDLKEKKDLSIEDYMLEEAESLFRLFKHDRENLQKALDQRQKQLDALKHDQEVDTQTLNKLNGGLAALQSLVTKYRNAHQAHKNKVKKIVKKPKQRRRKSS